tara:strand:+ start:722 stop:1255 length:534 start_codon:yes stop_codon:yes gene_type:complete
MKIKTYVLTVAKVFPKTHKRAGEPTNFPSSIHHGTKKHTIRSNYDLWKKRFEKIDAGEAVLSIRVWEGKPYNSKQREIFRLNKSQGIGIEKLENPDNLLTAAIEGKLIDWKDVATNDGLNFWDFCHWFKTRQKEPMAVIHFTDFRYNRFCSCEMGTPCALDVNKKWFCTQCGKNKKF